MNTNIDIPRIASELFELFADDHASSAWRSKAEALISEDIDTDDILKRLAIRQQHASSFAAKLLRNANLSLFDLRVSCANELLDTWIVSVDVNDLSCYIVQPSTETILPVDPMLFSGDVENLSPTHHKVSHTLRGFLLSDLFAARVAWDDLDDPNCVALPFDHAAFNESFVGAFDSKEEWFKHYVMHCGNVAIEEFETTTLPSGRVLVFGEQS